MRQNEAVVAMLGMVVSFGLPVLLVGMILWFKQRKLRMVHETVLRLAEKGLPVPPELLVTATDRRAGLRGGLVLVGLGIALAVFLGDVGAPWSIGLIPGLMGLGLLIASWIELRTGTKPPNLPR